jgi:hypothetical protein
MLSRSGMLRRYGILVYVPSRYRLLGVFAVLLVELLVSGRFLHSKFNILQTRVFCCLVNRKSDLEDTVSFQLVCFLMRRFCPIC